MDRRINFNSEGPAPRYYRVERRFTGERSAAEMVKSLVRAHT